MPMTNERRTIPVMRDLSQARGDCPMAPPPTATVYSRALHRACLIMGGIEKLAERLQVPVEDVRRWMTTDEAPPEVVFLQCVEIILLYTSRAQGQS